jgi:hypothetical protein
MKHRYGRRKGERSVWFLCECEYQLAEESHVAIEKRVNDQLV